MGVISCDICHIFSADPLSRSAIQLRSTSAPQTIFHSNQTIHVMDIDEENSSEQQQQGLTSAASGSDSTTSQTPGSRNDAEPGVLDFELVSSPSADTDHAEVKALKHSWNAYLQSPEDPFTHLDFIRAYAAYTLSSNPAEAPIASSDYGKRLMQWANEHPVAKILAFCVRRGSFQKLRDMLRLCCSTTIVSQSLIPLPLNQRCCRQTCREHC
jgi:hypothetical protein